MPGKKNAENESGDMPFLDHLEELRWTILKSLVAVAVACVVVGIFIAPFNDVLMYPFEKAELNYGRDVPEPRVSSALAPFFVMIEIAFFGGLFIALPFVLYFIGKFIAPAFTRKERKVLLPVIFCCTALFAAGAAMSFFWMMPIFFEFSFRLCDSFGWEILYDLEKYYSYVVWMPLACGLSFQLPIIIYALVYLEVLSPEFLYKNRRFSFVVILVASAVLTPSDPITMFLLAVPLYALYELSIFLGVRTLKGKLERRKKEEAEFEEEGRRMYESYRKSVEERRLKNIESGGDDDSYAGEDELEKRYSETDFKAEDRGGNPDFDEEAAAREADEAYKNCADDFESYDDDSAAALSLKEIDARIAKRNPVKSGDFLKKPAAENSAGEGAGNGESGGVSATGDNENPAADNSEDSKESASSEAETPKSE